MYVKRSTLPDSIGPGKTARGASFKGDTLADWVAEVDESAPEDVEIGKEEYIATVAANQRHNEALPLAHEEPPLTLEQRVLELESAVLKVR